MRQHIQAHLMLINIANSIGQWTYHVEILTTLTNLTSRIISTTESFSWRNQLASQCMYGSSVSGSSHFTHKARITHRKT